MQSDTQALSPDQAVCHSPSDPDSFIRPNPDKFFAREGVSPLSHAFDGKIAIHPGLGNQPLAEEEMRPALETLLETPLQGKTVAYIHVPFCQTHCLYCGFYNKHYGEDDSRVYTDALLAELAQWRDRVAVQSTPVHALYLGGGTPTALEAADLERILKAARENLPLANDCEITIEGRLANFDARKMEACLAGGANRFSLGVQSFNTEIRRSMGRLGTREDMIRGLELLMSYNQAAVIVDLIYGFPRQTMNCWLEDIAVAQSINLDGADCYQLNVYGQTPLGKAIQQGSIPPAADAPTQSAMFAASVEAMTQARYRRLSMSHWARTSRERNLYNLYVKGSANCLAFGPGAGGNFAGNFYINTPDYESWLQQVADGRKALAMLQPAPQRYFLFRAVAEGMEQGCLNLPALEQRFGLPLAKIWSPLLAQWQRAGLVTQDQGWVTLTLAGQFWQVNLSQLLLNYLKTMLEENNDLAA
ncbi:MAG: Anaerobilin synthase [Desulfovibrio sp.]